jgi:hypothetical protein
VIRPHRHAPYKVSLIVPPLSRARREMRELP